MDLLILLTMIILLLLEGFFSGSEIALVNADKIKLHAKASQGDKGAREVLRFFEQPDVMLTTTLVGTNISVVILTTLGTLLMIGWFGSFGEVIAVLVFTPIFLTFGEVVPKSVYQQNADRLAPVIVYPLRVFKIVLYPVIASFSLVARLAAKMAGMRQTNEKIFITRAQIRTVVDMAERGASLGMFDQTRIRRAIRFADTTVGEAMVPLAEIIALNDQEDTQRAMQLVQAHGYNRLPVYHGNIGNITGIVTLTVWDLMAGQLADKRLADLIRQPLYVSTLQKIDDLLPELRQREDHMAIVVDEFGTAIGMITIEDILEEVVGEISVGYDFDEYRPRRKRQYRKLDQDTYILDSRVPISEVNELLETDFPAIEFHTVGGLIENHLRRIPGTGEQIVVDDWRFIVEEATERSIKKIRVERIQ